MIKLYKTIGSELHYWETWDKNDTSAIIHWGIVGQTGENKEIKSGFFSSIENKLKKMINEKTSEGYLEFNEKQPVNLEIEYAIEGFGTHEDLEKRHKLEEKLNEILGWTGLGHVDGGSIGSGTMEIGCLVVDFDIAKKVIEEKLKDTEFSNYTKIFKLE